jgi:hypothetical protein
MGKKKKADKPTKAKARATIEKQVDEIIEAVKAKGVTVLAPSRYISTFCGDVDYKILFDFVMGLWNHNGTFRTVRILDEEEDVLELAGLSEDDCTDWLIKAIEDRFLVFVAPADDGEKRETALCFWDEPDNPYPGTPAGSTPPIQ